MRKLLDKIDVLSILIGLFAVSPIFFMPATARVAIFDSVFNIAVSILTVPITILLLLVLLVPPWTRNRKSF